MIADRMPRHRVRKAVDEFCEVFGTRAGFDVGTSKGFLGPLEDISLRLH